MNNNGIKAVTFDLWNTLFVEVTPKISRDRACKIATAFSKFNFKFTEADVELVINRAWKEHRRQWALGIQFTNSDASFFIAQSLGLAPSPETLKTIRDALEYMYPADLLTPCDNLEDLLRSLTTIGLRIGLISDTGFSPGKVLRKRLTELGLSRFFCGMSFSDEIGVFKPHPSIFAHSLTYLQCSAQTTVHVGDLWKNDIVGARSAGFRTIRYRAWNDDQPKNVDADFVSDNHKQTAEWILAKV